MIKITDDLLAEVSARARTSGRKRTNHNFHRSNDDAVQRLLNAAEPETYIQPHRHIDPDKTEAFIILKGRVVVIEFDDDGGIIDHTILDRMGGVLAVEIEPRAWHTFIALEPGSVLYEVKDGPYNPSADKHAAPWAPEEGSTQAEEFKKKILAALPGA